MREWLKMSTIEEKGYWALHLLMLLVLTYKVISANHKEPPKYSQAFYDSINDLLNRPKPELSKTFKEPETNQEGLSRPVSRSRKTLSHDATPRVIDPNTATVGELISIGLKKFQAERLVKFRSRGARFNKLEDVEKVYGLSKEEVKSLAKFLSFPKVQNRNLADLHEKALRVDINLADSGQLTTLKGIGPYYAKKIISYRNRLGGFNSISQLLEIKGIDSSILRNNSEVIFLGEKYSLEKIELNSVVLKDLAKHPYIGYKKALAIIRYREQHGPFLEIKQITNSVLIDEDDLAKIAPYLSIGGREDKASN